MRIADITVTTLLFEYDDDRKFRYAGGTCTHRVTSLIRVYTECGETGIGSVYSHPDIVRIIIEDHLRPHLLGHDARQTDALWQNMEQLTRWYGRKGAALSALGALDIAFWDLRGKAEGKPIGALLGADRFSIPAYASGLLWKDDMKALSEEAARHRDNGFRRMKMRLGRGDDYDLDAIDTALSTIGPDGEVMVDGSMRYSLANAKRLAAQMEDRRVLWYEEPFHPDDIDSFADLRADTSVNIAAGENEYGFHGFRELVRAGAVDVVQPDAVRCGGITEAHRIGTYAADNAIKVAPHSWSDAVAIIANAQFATALPNAITVEVDQTGNPFVDELLTSPITVSDGMLSLNDAPGLGVELNMAVVEKYSHDAGKPLPPGAYSDMVFK